MIYPTRLQPILWHAEPMLIEGHAIVEMEIVFPDIVSLVAVHFSAGRIIPYSMRPKTRAVARYILAQHWHAHFDGNECRFEDGILLVDGTFVPGKQVGRYVRRLLKIRDCKTA